VVTEHPFQLYLAKGPGFHKAREATITVTKPLYSLAQRFAGSECWLPDMGISNYSFIYTGERYEASANIPINYAKPWYTSDFSLSQASGGRNPDRPDSRGNNLFNQQYEVVQSYPNAWHQR
jgi:hypothetical protein